LFTNSSAEVGLFLVEVYFTSFVNISQSRISSGQPSIRMELFNRDIHVLYYQE